MPFVPGFVYGVVTDNADPLKLGRVKVHVPGFAEPDTGYWCDPFAWPGAGNAGTFGSRYHVRIGATVMLIFEHGDTDAGAVYAPAMYGADADSGALQGPDSVLHDTDGTELTPEQVVQRTTIFENDTFAVFIVDQADPPDHRLILEHKSPYPDVATTGITINANDGFSGKPQTSVTMSITAQTGLRLFSNGMIHIEGAAVFINGRQVSAGTTGSAGSI